ncbi:MAG TPA: NUDIX domain-containing protein [Nocardioides sp.]
MTTPAEQQAKVQVVGAAILRHGCVLAARRTAPVEAAGRWEFPGGKVEPGETHEAALVREIREELGCVIEVTGRLGGTAAIRDTHQLTVHLARLVGGEPTPTEHDAVRWLAPEELGDVDWLDSDRPFLAELRDRLLDGDPLPGGSVGGAARIGETVRRPTGPWTPAVHALLAHTHDAGLPGVPRVHGFDERGREILDYLPGEVVDVDTDQISEARLTALGRWTRAFHDAQADPAHPFRHDGPWRFPPAARAEVVAHNDLAPYNLAFAGDDLVGVFDWDVAGPSTVLFELAHIAWNAVPLFREIPPDEAAHRLETLAAAYAGPSAAEILAAVTPRVRSVVDGIPSAAAAGDEGMRRLMSNGEPGLTLAALEALQRRLPAIEAALQAHKTG